MPNVNKVENDILPVLIQIAEIVDNGVIWLKADGSIIRTNEKFVEELNYNPKSDTLPKTIFEVDPTTSLLSWKKHWKKLVKEKQLSFETEHINADGAIFPVRNESLILDTGEEEICICIIENLMESSRYKGLLNLTTKVAGIGCWEWDLVQDEWVVTPEIYQQLNIPLDIVPSKKSFEDFMKERMELADYNGFMQSLESSIKTGKPIDMELSIKLDNVFKAFQCHIHPEWHEDQTIRIFGVLQNLEKVARRTDDLYFTKFCMDNARDMIFWLDSKGIITYINRTTSEKLGYRPDELIGKSVKVLTPHKEVDMDKHWIELKKERSIEFETIHTSKNGEPIPVSIIANYVNYRGKEFNCAFVRDLSKTRKRSEVIKIAKHTLDNALDMIFWLNKDGTFRYFNNTFQERTGYSRSAIKTMTIVDFFPEIDIDQFNKEWEDLEKNKKFENIDRDLKLKNGTIVPTEMTVAMIKFEEEEFTTTVLRDITERKAKESLIINQLDEIKRLNDATKAENIDLKEEIDSEFNFSNIISRDPNYKRVLRQVEQVADTNATVLILGETGTGKELLARAVHQLSERFDKPMVKVNCGALPENLIESELFGHEKGAFTGAYQRKIGKFERADKGTIFLDEIGELPLEMQAKLLRVLQEGEIERVGGTETINVDVRIIAATNRNPEEEVAKGKFREDLFYRLNVFPILNIPLRERPEDIPILVKHFADKYSKKINKQITEISQIGLNKLMGYNFLGNVRELENLVERAVILSKSKVLTFDVPDLKESSAGSSTFKTMEKMQVDHIIEALQRTKGKVSGKAGAAELLGMNDKTLISRMKKLNIDKRDYLK